MKSQMLEIFPLFAPQFEYYSRTEDTGRQEHLDPFIFVMKFSSSSFMMILRPVLLVFGFHTEATNMQALNVLLTSQFCQKLIEGPRCPTTDPKPVPVRCWKLFPLSHGATLALK